MQSLNLIATKEALHRCCIAELWHFQFPQWERERFTRADSHLKGDRRKSPELAYGQKAPARYSLVVSRLPFPSSLAAARGSKNLMRKQQGMANTQAINTHTRCSISPSICAPSCQPFNSSGSLGVIPVPTCWAGSYCSQLPPHKKGVSGNLAEKPLRPG